MYCTTGPEQTAADLESADLQIVARGYCLECGEEMATGSAGEPVCPDCHDFAEQVPCDHPCDAHHASPVCSECGTAMKNYEDGDGYCCPACGTDDGSGTYRARA